MSLVAGSVSVELQVNEKGFTTGFNNAETTLTSFDSKVKSQGNSIKNSLTNIFEFSAGGLLASGVTGLGQSIQDTFTKTTDSAKEYEKAMVSLKIISKSFKIDQDEAVKTSNKLGDSLKIGPTASANALQNLLKGGLSLDKAEELMKRFNNEALTGKTAGISQAKAVENLSYAYATNNSTIGDLSGINENYENIIKKGRESLIAKGVALKDITDDTAKYEGMINLTNLTLGSAEQLNGTAIDTEARKQQAYQETQRVIGTSLLPTLVLFDEIQIKLFNSATNLFGFLQQNPEVVLGLSTTFGILGAVLLWTVAPSMVAVAVAGWAMIAPFLPIIALAGAVGGAVAGLAWAWNNNFFGMRDTVISVFNTIKSVISGAMSGLKWWFNMGIDNMNTLISGVNTISSAVGITAIPNIPKLSSGVSNFEGGMAYVHAGETLQYLPKGTDVNTRGETMNMALQSDNQPSQIIINVPSGSFVNAQALDDLAKMAKSAFARQGFVTN